MDDMFNIVKKGYDPDEVKKYISKLEAVLTSYKEKDATIKNAIISAQAAADNIVKQAHDEAAEIRDEAVRVFDMSLAAIASQKESINSYLREYETLVHKYTSSFYKNEALTFFSKADDIDSRLLEIRASFLEKLRAGEKGEDKP